MSDKHATVTLTLQIQELRELFAGGNHSGGNGRAEDADPLGLALDIIQHAAMELHTIHDVKLPRSRGQHDYATCR